MVFVMVQGANVRGVFESIWCAKVFFSDTTGVKIADIEEQDHINGDVLFMINNYCQARLKKTIFY